MSLQQQTSCPLYLQRRGRCVYQQNNNSWHAVSERRKHGCYLSYRDGAAGLHTCSTIGCLCDQTIFLLLSMTCLSLIHIAIFLSCRPNWHSINIRIIWDILNCWAKLDLKLRPAGSTVGVPQPVSSHRSALQLLQLSNTVSAPLWRCSRTLSGGSEGCCPVRSWARQGIWGLIRSPLFPWHKTVSSSPTYWGKPVSSWEMAWPRAGRLYVSLDKHQFLSTYVFSTLLYASYICIIYTPAAVDWNVASCQ